MINITSNFPISLLLTCCHRRADYFVFFYFYSFFHKYEIKRKKKHCKNTQKEIHRNKKSKYFFVFRNKKEISRNLYHIMKLLQLSFATY